MTVRVATLNMASGRDLDGVTRLPRLARAVGELGADVVTLHEVDHLLPRSGRVDQADAVATACAGDGPAWHVHFAAALHGSPGPGGGARPAASTRADQPSYGNALLSRHPVVQTWELRLRAARGRRPVPLPPGTRPPVWFILDEQRVALAALVDTPDGAVTVVTTHLSFAPLRAAAQLRRVRAWAAGLPGPLVLTGDLNLPGGLPRRLTGWTSLVSARTFPAARPRLQLDHVLSREPLDVDSARAVRVGGSDHQGLVVDLRLPG